MAFCNPHNYSNTGINQVPQNILSHCFHPNQNQVVPGSHQDKCVPDGFQKNIIPDFNQEKMIYDSYQDKMAPHFQHSLNPYQNYWHSDPFYSYPGQVQATSSFLNYPSTGSNLYQNDLHLQY